MTFGNVADAHSALAIASGYTRGTAAGSVAPGTADRGIGYRVMIGIMHGNGHDSRPFATLVGGYSIQISNMDVDRRGS